MFKIYLLNAKRWLDLPTDVTRLEGDIISSYANDYGYKVGARDELCELNKIAKKLADFNDDEKRALIGITNGVCFSKYTVKEAINIVRNGEFRIHEVDNVADLARSLGNLIGDTTMYTDEEYEQIGKELCLYSDDYVFYKDYCVEIYN